MWANLPKIAKPSSGFFWSQGPASTLVKPLLMYTLFHFLEHVYALAPPLLITPPARASWGFLPHPRCMGPLCALCTWKVRGEAANRVETKGFFLLRSHIGAISKTAVPLPGVPNPLSPPPRLYPIHIACRWFMKISKGRKGPPKWRQVPPVRKTPSSLSGDI